MAKVSAVTLDHCELVHRQPVVRPHLTEIHQPHMIARDAAIGPGILDRHTIAQHPVKGAVRLRERRRPHPQHLAQCLLPRLIGNGRVQPPDGLAQAPHQHHLRKRLPLRGRFTGREVRPVPNRVAQIPEPRQAGVFHH